MSSRRGQTGGLLVFATAAVLATVGCADFSRGDPTPGGGGMTADGGAGDAVGDGGALSFAASVYPLLVDGCASCHKAGGEAAHTNFIIGGTAAATYMSVVKLVTVADPGASRLLAKAAGRGHGGGAIYAASSASYQVILTWIVGGALP